MPRIKTVLVVGRLPPPAGGTTKSLEFLVKELAEEQRIKSTVFDLNRIASYQPQKLFFSVRALLRKTRDSDHISVHVSLHRLSDLGLTLLLLAKATGKTASIRRFGGTCVKELPAPKRLLVVLAYRLSDIIFCQTIEQCTEANSIVSKRKRVEWLPTARPLINKNKQRPRASFTAKLVFISQVKKEKGVFEAIEAVRRARQENLTCYLRVYGPLYDNITSQDLESHDGVAYGGELNTEEVRRELSDADAILLPTYYTGEGYPGILIEAMQNGCPIITTRWKSLPELVKDAAIFVSPADVHALKQGIKRLYLEKNIFAQLSRKSIQRGQVFTSDKQADHFISSIISLYENS